MGIPENKSKTGEISQDYLQKVMLIYILCFMDDIFINRKQGVPFVLPRVHAFSGHVGFVHHKKC